PLSPLFPYTPLFRSRVTPEPESVGPMAADRPRPRPDGAPSPGGRPRPRPFPPAAAPVGVPAGGDPAVDRFAAAAARDAAERDTADRKSTRLNSSHLV